MYLQYVAVDTCLGDLLGGGSLLVGPDHCRGGVVRAVDVVVQEDGANVGIICCGRADRGAGAGNGGRG